MLDVIVDDFFFSIFRGPIHRERRNYLRTALKEMSLILSDQPGLLGPKVCNFLTLIELVSLHLLFSQHRPCQILKRNYYPMSFCNLCMPVHIKLLCLCRRWNFKGTLPMEARSPSGLWTRLGDLEFKCRPEDQGLGPVSRKSRKRFWHESHSLNSNPPIL